MPDETLRDLERQALIGDLAAARRLLLARDRAGLCRFHAQPKQECKPCKKARNISWTSLFSGGGEKCEGATPEELDLLEDDLRRSLSDEELEQITGQLARANLQRTIDPSRWTLPDMPLPPSFLSFLTWSNGGTFVRGARELGFFGTAQMREYLLGYCIPEWMPGATPFAFDGGGTFYMFDMRRMPVDGEYPVIFVQAGVLSFDEDDCWLVADNFQAVCEGTTDPHEDRIGPQPSYPERADIWLVARPKGGLKGLIAVKEALAISTSIRELKLAFDKLPARLLHDVPFFPNAVRCARYIRSDPCLEVRAVDRPDGRIDVTDLGG